MFNNGFPHLFLLFNMPHYYQGFIGLFFGHCFDILNLTLTLKIDLYFFFIILFLVKEIKMARY